MTAGKLGLIFDVDGVLIDSYWSHYKSWQIAAAEFGFTITEDQFRQNFGRKSHETIAERWGNQLTPEQISRFEQRKEAAYRDVIRDDFPGMDGAVIEDAPAGIAAAKAAGTLAIGLVSTGHSWESLSAADRRVGSLRDLSPQRISAWFDRYG